MLEPAGARPVIMLNKADLCDDVEAASNGVRARMPFVDVVAVMACGIIAYLGWDAWQDLR